MALTAREIELLKLYKIELWSSDIVWGFKVPYGIQERVEVHMWGAGGGGGGADAGSSGGQAAGGQYMKIVVNVKPNDNLVIVPGGPGLSGQSNRPLAKGGNAGTGFIFGGNSYSGGRGGNAGSSGSSGAGGGGGGATVLMLNGEIIAICGGGGGGGGAGLRSGGATATNNPYTKDTGFTNGQQGQDHYGDGGGGGGSAGGYRAYDSGSSPAGDIGGNAGYSGGTWYNPLRCVSGSTTFGSGIYPGKYGDADYAFYSAQMESKRTGIGGIKAQDGGPGGAVIVYSPTIGYVKDSGQWKGIEKVFIKDAGVWKEIQGGLYKVNGKWQPLYSGEFNKATANTGQVGINFRTRAMDIPPPAPVVYYSYDGGSDFGGFGPSANGCDVGIDAGATSCSADGGGGGSGSKIVCTAMNQAYGFGSFRNAIWLRYAEKNLTKAHEVGYHTLFQPLVKLGYEKDVKAVRVILEHIARHRSTDLRAEMRGLKRDKLGRAYRFVLEPLCYIVGKIKGY